MSKHFTHLHLHTDYSLLDGAISTQKLINFGKEHNFKALAITDHGNIFGAVKFFQQCKKSGIKPILGIEAYITENARLKDANNKYYHQILLVQNQQGYRNLCKLISYSFQEGFYFKPRIDYPMLEKYNEGLIVTSACLGGHISKLLQTGDDTALNKQLDWFMNVFGPERYFLEIQPEDQAEQKILNNHLYRLSAEKNIQLIAAGDCHYVHAEDREAHEIMLAIQTHNKLDDPDRYTFGDCRVHMRTAEEMLSLFPDHPDAIWNTGKIADQCEFDFETDKLFFPKFEIPQEFTQESFFRHLCQKGLDTLKTNGLILADNFAEYQERLTMEVDLIINMGFIGYFLVVSDFIQWAHRSGIPVGPGRGSAAGSLVAWALEITNIDPLKYNLLFERFLNPERVTMPDIDIDFCIEGRDRVIEYVRQKYGHDKVCHIITFGTMMAKGVIKDVARVLGFSFEDSNAITNLIPDQLKITLDEAIEQEPRLKDMVANNPKVNKLVSIARKLEGLTRHASKHAAGIVISPEPIDEVLPVYVPPKSTELVAQYAMSELESIGFLKIDFLGLKNLTLIAHAIQLIKKNHGIMLDMNKIPLDDTRTFQLICAGNTSGVFQLESEGLKEVLRKLQPDKFEDIIAVNALYRPGPLGSGMVDDFIERRHGRQQITYLFDELAPILQETYGVIVYQEQVMKIASTIAGYSLGESDILRRAMGKKKAEVMAEQSELFLQKSQERGFDGKKAAELFDLMAYFAGYGFNKSHSAAYALIAYQTAYLKANYLAEFMACLISLEATNADKMSFYLQEAKDMGLAILPPDINTSEIQFSVVDNKILFGLQGIKNVGLAALENIIAERTKKGPFLDLLDFCKRIDLRTANKRVIENLICAGAFDKLPGNRAQQFEEIHQIIEQAVAYKRDTATGQMGLFGGGAQINKEHIYYEFEPRKEWADKEKLEKEHNAMGFYVTAHPLEAYSKQLKWFTITPFDQALQKVKESNTGQEITIIGCGLIKNRKDILTKKGDRMSFVQLEDTSSAAELILFPKTFSAVEQWLDEYTVFIVKGTIDPTSTTKCKIKVNNLVPIELVLQAWPRIEKTVCTLPATVEQEMLEKLKHLLPSGTVPLEIIFHENGKQLQLSTKEKIKLEADLLKQIEHELQINVQCYL
ncbi:MAG TPA: DNA polymerase III subunit alpha [Candidatus Dependentiae bacterium]|nr:DNA polymerase III subunit alpha [Candidatus Dependentiae bacterium]HRQ62405.1 DNA polymerase III subunit alpha [Candidatus Dependentiae bacterium]